jgi:ATP-dependent Clp protease adaptor protein ClpS
MARNDARPDVETDAERDTERGLEWRVAQDTDGQWVVIVHNDDHTPMDFVTAVLMRIFYLPYREAVSVMLEAHYGGKAYVMTLPHEEAKYRVGQAHSAARAAGYPLTFTIEPA